jgi:hypothetical protein
VGIVEALLFQTAYAIVKNRRPFTDFILVCELIEMRGLTICETYRNHTTKFVGYISAVEQKHIQEFSDVNVSLIIFPSGYEYLENVYWVYGNSS